ncbi:uncharacterized protein DS421_15g500920 [Arachis hypogaea]|nr:uncharacterized protein DS421_15g500920 [Arachis hypogaea]
MAPGEKRQRKEEIEGAPPPSLIFSGDVANNASSSVTVDASAEGKGKAVAVMEMMNATPLDLICDTSSAVLRKPR